MVKIELPPFDSVSARSPWCRGLHEALKVAAVFNKEVHLLEADLPHWAGDGVHRWNQAFPIRVNGHLIMIDTWDFGPPTLNWIEGNGPDIPIEMILKIQSTGRDWSQEWHERKVPVRPWTMFCVHHMDWVRRVPELRKRYDDTSKQF